jgi:hypothetical protein
VTGERERALSRYLDRLKEVAILQTTDFAKFYIYNMETVTDSRGIQKGPPERDPADSLACSGLRAQLRLEQRLLRSKDGSGLW